MKLSTKFNAQNLSGKLKQAWSWAFLNKGNEIDYTRRRISDGTPLHSTGLNRLAKDWRTKATVIGSGITYLVTKGDIDLTAAFLGSCAFGMFLNTASANVLRSIHYSKMCFNTQPKDADSTSITTAKKIPGDMLTSAAHSGVGLFFIATSESNAMNIALPIWLPTIVGEARSFHHFRKVLKNEWTIEETPPPKKKPVKEKAPSKVQVPSLA